MAKKMKLITCFLLLATAAAILWYRYTAHTPILSLAITLGTCLYHFAMRLTVGYAVNAVMKNKADPRSPWFREKPFEKRLYRWLRVRKWYGKMPTCNPDLFAVEKHTSHEIVGAMCQAEVVHTLIAVFSLLPLLTAPLFGAFLAFLITSLLAAAYDLLFVVMQRYMRPRVLRFADRQTLRQSNECDL